MRKIIAIVMMIAVCVTATMAAPTIYDTDDRVVIYSNDLQDVLDTAAEYYDLGWDYEGPTMFFAAEVHARNSWDNSVGNLQYLQFWYQNMTNI